MNPELIGTIFSGVSVLVTGVGGLLVVRRRKQDDETKQDLDELQYRRRESRFLKSQNIAATRHIYRLELEMAKDGKEPPERPRILDQDPDLPDRPRRDPDSGTFPALPPYGSGGTKVSLIKNQRD